jgi:septum formation inhibitor-activating ATPase MinD
MMRRRSVIEPAPEAPVLRRVRTEERTLIWVARHPVVTALSKAEVVNLAEAAKADGFTFVFIDTEDGTGDGDQAALRIDAIDVITTTTWEVDE